MKRLRAISIWVFALVALCVAGFALQGLLVRQHIDVYTQTSATGTLVVYVNNPDCAVGAGAVCHSSANICGQTNTGAVQCDSSCSASTPPDSQCTNNNNNTNNSSGGGGGGGGGGGAATEQTAPEKNTPAQSCADRKKMGDLNCSKKIDIQDFSVLAYWFKRPLTSSAVALGVDLNHDGKVTLADFSILAYYWGK